MDDAVILFAREHCNGKPGRLGVLLWPVPVEQLLELTFDVDPGEDARAIQLSMTALAAGGDALQTWSESVPLRRGEWNTIERHYVAPNETAKLELWIQNEGKTILVVAGPSLVLARGKAKPISLQGPGVLRATAGSFIKRGPGLSAKRPGTVTFPVPLLTEHQVPLAFELQVTPKDALRDFRWVKRPDGVNWLCEVDVVPPKKGAEVRWIAHVLVGRRQDVELSPLVQPRAPEETKEWLRSTACVQSDDEGIVAKAAELGKDADAVLTYVKNVLAFTSSNRGTGSRFRALDAASALDCGGSCTSRANLAAALLRARGIPARTSAHLPTWAGTLYEHWHVEYWHPLAGWTWIEPTLGKMLPEPYSVVVLNVASPADEDQGFDDVIGHSGVMPGVARYAVHEHSQNLLVDWGDDKDGRDPGNEAVVACALDLSAAEEAALFKAARAAWTTLAEQLQEGELEAERTRLVRGLIYEHEVQVAALQRALQGFAPPQDEAPQDETPREE